MKTKLLFLSLVLLAMSGSLSAQAPLTLETTANGLTQHWSAGGNVSRGQIVKLNSSGQVVPMATTDISGALGVAVTSATLNGDLLVSVGGSPLVQVDGACTAGNVVLISTTSAGQGHCAITASNQTIGTAINGSTGAGFVNTQLSPLSSAGAGGGISPNSPGAITSSPGPVFNVANYTGAFHDTRSNSTCDSTISATQITCSAVAGITPFTAADVGKRFNCGKNASGPFYPAGTTITSIVSGTVAQLSGTRLVADVGAKCTYGHVDDTALAAAFTAALAQSCSTSGQAIGNACAPTAAPTLYLPAGGWMACNPGAGLPVFYFGNNRKGFTIMGDGYDVTNLYNCDNAPNMTAFGFWISNQNMTNLYVHDLTIDGSYLQIPPNGFGFLAFSQAQTTFRNVHIQAGKAGGGLLSQGAIFGDNVTVDTQTGVGFQCSGCGGEMHNSSSSNSSGANILIQNVSGENVGEGFRWWGGIVDEGSVTPTQIVNSMDVWFNSTAGFGTGAAPAMTVDGTSFVHLSGGIWGVFGNDGNAGGVSIAAGGVVQASDSRFVSSGTRACIANSGSFFDNGGNSCESVFPIVSGTSTGTTAVLTLTTLGANANTNCSVGDALIVEGASPAGYNGYFPAGATSGITATGAATLTYTTAGSNLGAATAVGAAYCRNLQSYTGTLPKALLNNPIPNTCVLSITPIVNGTTYQLCEWPAGSATNISRITAGSQVVTTCATPPIVTISNGTVSETLTLTSGKSVWDSSIDASTGVGTTIFKPSISATGTDRITVKYDAGALSVCATPPTNFRISYNISPILSN